MSNIIQPSEWLRLYGDYLFSLAILKTGDKELAHDLVQDTFLSAIKAKETFKGNSTEKTWLTAILKNKIIDYYRKKDVMKGAGDYLATSEISFHNSFFNASEADFGHWTKEAAPAEWKKEGADAAINSKEFYKILQYCIEKMPSKLAPVFLARFIDEHDAQKICKEFNLTSSNYWVIVHRAKVLMRGCLEKNWFTP
jgi:RNA polymerase sigma-70 factor (TIGR02943 family)